MRERTGFLIVLMVSLAVLASCGGTSGRGSSTPPADSGGGGDDGGGSGDGGGDSGGTSDDAIIADNGAAILFTDVPAEYITQAKTNLHVLYGRTQYGMQVDSGMQILYEENSDLYVQASTFLRVDVTGNDLDSVGGESSWDQVTRAALEADATVNVVIWAWGSFVQVDSEADIDTYLATMSALEEEFPDVRFVYMTGHLSDNPDYQANLLARNEQIRTSCRENGKVLYDFAAIESYDPDGVSYVNTGTDACEWCSDWCTENTCPSCSMYCNSHCFNCYLKGKAFWWLMARLAGWDGN